MALEKITTDQGLRVYVESIPNSRIADIEVVIGTGSVHETENEAGLCHALEHTVHVTDKFASRQTLRDFDGENSILSNAYTSYNHTLHVGYSPYVDPLMQRMGEVLFRATFEPDYIANEVKAIQQEAKRDLDDLSGVHRNGMYYGLFGKPYGRDILGYNDRLAFAPEQLQEYYKRNYVQSNMALVAVGNVGMEEILQAVDRYFEPSVHDQPQFVLPQPQRLGANSTGLIRTDSENARISVSTPMAPEFVEHYLDRKVLYETAIDVMRSQCLESLRFDAGIAYEADASFLKHNNPNAWTITGYVTTDPENVDQARTIIADAMNKSARSYTDKRIKSSIGRSRAFWLKHVDDRKIDLHAGNLEQGIEPRDLNSFADAVLNQTTEDIRDALDDIIAYTGAASSMTHITGPQKAVANVDLIIDQSTIM